MPFYLRGLWGSQFSRSSSKLKELRNAPLHRSVVVAFGKPLPKDTPADVLKRRIFEQATRSWQQAMGSFPAYPTPGFKALNAAQASLPWPTRWAAHSTQVKRLPPAC